MPIRYLILLATVVPTLVLDQLTKLYIDRAFRLYESLPVIDGLFSITYVRNQGAAFGILANHSLRVPFFIGIALVAAVGILWAIHRLRPEQKLASFSLALILSGAVGNLIDRIRLGEVIDFLDVYWRGHHWPAFNIADSAISVGVALLLWEMWREERQKSSSARSAS